MQGTQQSSSKTVTNLNSLTSDDIQLPAIKKMCLRTDNYGNIEGITDAVGVLQSTGNADYMFGPVPLDDFSLTTYNTVVQTASDGTLEGITAADGFLKCTNGTTPTYTYDNTTVPGIQTEIDNMLNGTQAFTKVSTALIQDTGLNTSTALITDSSKNISSSSTTSTELGYVSGVTSSIQTQINTVNTDVVNILNGTQAFTKVLTALLQDTGLTASTALVSDSFKNVISSSTTSTELGYVHGVTSAIQTQIANILNGTTSFTALNNSGLTTTTTLTSNGATQINGTVTIVAASGFPNTKMIIANPSNGNFYFTLGNANSGTKNYYMAIVNSTYNANTNAAFSIERADGDAASINGNTIILHQGTGFLIYNVSNSASYHSIRVANTEIIRILSTGVQITGSLSISGAITYSSLTISSLTASTALVCNSSKQIISSATTATELGYVSGVTSAIQTQINTANTNIATNSTNIATNTTNIATNTSNIATNTTNIATNTTAIANISNGTTPFTGTVTMNNLAVSGYITCAVITPGAITVSYLDVSTYLEAGTYVVAGTFLQGQQLYLYPVSTQVGLNITTTGTGNLCNLSGSSSTTYHIDNTCNVTSNGSLTLNGTGSTVSVYGNISSTNGALSGLTAAITNGITAKNIILTNPTVNDTTAPVTASVQCTSSGNYIYCTNSLVSGSTFKVDNSGIVYGAGLQTTGQVIASGSGTFQSLSALQVTSAGALTGASIATTGNISTNTFVSQKAALFIHSNNAQSLSGVTLLQINALGTGYSSIASSSFVINGNPYYSIFLDSASAYYKITFSCKVALTTDYVYFAPAYGSVINPVGTGEFDYYSASNIVGQENNCMSYTFYYSSATYGQYIRFYVQGKATATTFTYWNLMIERVL